MATKVVVCPECESPVEAGRFSCSSCGAVVAAVASVSRSFAPAPAVAPAPVEEVCRFAEGADGAFRLVGRFPLGDRRAAIA